MHLRTRDRLRAVLLSPERLARWRVPLGWLFGLSALYFAIPTPRVYAAGVAVALAGELIRLWAAGHLEKNRQLALGGPYRWTRNPLYLGSLLIGSGFAFATGRFVLLGVVAAFYIAVYVPVMKREAAHLAQIFPGDYAGFVERVPLFWPRIPRGDGASLGTLSMERLLRNQEHWTVLGWLIVAGFLGWKLL